MSEIIEDGKVREAAEDAAEVAESVEAESVASVAVAAEAVAPEADAEDTDAENAENAADVAGSVEVAETAETAAPEPVAVETTEVETVGAAAEISAEEAGPVTPAILSVPPVPSVPTTPAIAEVPAAPLPPTVSPWAPPKPQRKRKFPWRWVGAVVTMLAVGTGCAFAVMAPQRTELPGLKTAADGRYDFAPLVLPTLAPGQSDPNATANQGQQHISDIRKLLLSPPKGAVLDRSLPGSTGWVSKAATLALISGSSSAPEQFVTDGWRHTAGIAWKTPDGATTQIWLVQFIDDSAASDASAMFATFNGGAMQQDDSTNIAVADGTSAQYFRVVKGSTATWYGQVEVDDTEFLIEFTAPKSFGITPFEQEIDLQVEMLQ